VTLWTRARRLKRAASIPLIHKELHCRTKHNRREKPANRNGASAVTAGSDATNDGACERLQHALDSVLKYRRPKGPHRIAADAATAFVNTHSLARYSRNLRLPLAACGK